MKTLLACLMLLGAVGFGLRWLDRISREDLRERGVSLKDD